MRKHFIATSIDVNYIIKLININFYNIDILKLIYLPLKAYSFGRILQNIIWPPIKVIRKYVSSKYYNN